MHTTNSIILFHNSWFSVPTNEEMWRTWLDSKVSWQLYSSHKVALRSITLNTIMTARAQWELLFRETCRRWCIDLRVYGHQSTCVQSSECNSLVADASNERESSKRNRASERCIQCVCTKRINAPGCMRRVYSHFLYI